MTQTNNSIDSGLKSIAIKRAMLLELTSTSGITVVNSTILALLIAYVLRDLISSKIIITWLSVFICLNIVRLITTFNHKRKPAVTGAELDMQLNQFRFGLIASGLLWGLACLFMYPDNATSQQMFLMFILAGLSAGCVVSYSADFISSVAFVMMILTPMLLRLLTADGEVAVAMTISVLLYIFFMIASIRHVNRNLLDILSARYDANERESEAKQLAFYDVLTSLPNRRLMIDRINHALAMSKRTGREGALLFLDLDHFKTLNDTLGHDMGDLMLKQVADRLLSCVRASDTVSRLGGDEFTVMLEDLSQDSSEALAQVKLIVEQIITSLSLPYQLSTHLYQSTVSIGVAMFVDAKYSHEELLKNADIAMYKAKRAGRNAARYFDSTMQVSEYKSAA